MDLRHVRMGLLYTLLHLQHVGLRLVLYVFGLLRHFLEVLHGKAGGLQRCIHVHQSLLQNVHHSICFQQVISCVAGHQSLELRTVLLQFRGQKLKFLPELGDSEVRVIEVLTKQLHVTAELPHVSVFEFANHLLSSKHIMPKLLQFGIRHFSLLSKSRDVIVCPCQPTLHLSYHSAGSLETLTCSIKRAVGVGEVVSKPLHPRVRVAESRLQQHPVVMLLLQANLQFITLRQQRLNLVLQALAHRNGLTVRQGSKRRVGLPIHQEVRHEKKATNEPLNARPFWAEAA
mmetsp:Transcript_27273/g.71870  ORF Transcript_27273/g.71870 Transcript_27273/m.71870 type:complete len:287 (-) Transcript_27273:4-864(-)